jgi:hypothetical protein
VAADPMEFVENGDNEKESRKSQLNTLVAIAVALLATFIGICKVKDDNIVQGMQQAQANMVDHWNYYQARKIRGDLAQATVDQLRLQQLQVGAPYRAAYQKQIDHYQSITDEQAQKREDVKKQAEDDQKTYDSLNEHDDQFDLSDALLSISIALLALTALTQKRWLFVVSLVPTGLGVFCGLAGLFGWHASIHLPKLLS